MANVLETIRERLAEVDSRIEQLRAEIDKAEGEKRDLQTTVRVLAGVGVGDSVAAEIIHAKPKTSRPAKEKKALMLGILGVGRQGGKQPKSVHKALTMRGIDDISIQVVRTTLWRSAEAGELESADGYYWKREAEESLYDETSAHNSSAGMTSGGTQPNVRYREREASHDAPSSRSGEGGT